MTSDDRGAHGMTLGDRGLDRRSMMYPLDALEQLYHSLPQQGCTLLTRLERRRDQLAQAGPVLRALQKDLDYLGDYLEDLRSQMHDDVVSGNAPLRDTRHEL